MEKKDRIPNEAWESRWPNEEPVTKHLGKNYRLEGEPRAVFWGEYREMLKKVEEKLHPGQVITPRDDLSIGLMGNSNLLTEHFDLRSPDRNPISGIDLKTGKKWTIPYAGKSGFIDFSHIVDPKTGEIVKPPTQDDLQMLVDANFGRDKRPTDHAYFATVQELNHIDYTPY